MRVLKAIMIVTVLASALSLGACAQHKEAAPAPPPAYQNKLDFRSPIAEGFDLKARSYPSAWPFCICRTAILAVGASGHLVR